LQQGLSISSAVSRAREGLAVDADSLIAALLAYQPNRAHVAIQASLALRSVERTVNEVLLSGLDQIRCRKGPESAAWAFAARWGADWLHEATRLAPPPVHPATILLGDASRDELDPDAPHLRALELLCVRAGVKVLTLSVRGVDGIADAISAHRPNVVVVAGSHVDDDTVARWAYAIRRAVGRIPLVVYRRGTTQTHNTALPVTASAARHRLLELIAKPTAAVWSAPHRAPYMERIRPAVVVGL
jgi:hypothetical protein